MATYNDDLDKEEVDELWADGFAMEKYMAEKEWDEEKDKFQEEYSHKFDKIKRQLITQFTHIRLKLVNKTLKYMRELLEELYSARTEKLETNLQQAHKVLQTKLYDNWCKEKAYAKNQFKKQIAKFEILEKEKDRAREMERLAELDEYRHNLEKEWRQRFTAAFYSWDSYVKNTVEVDLNDEWDRLKNKAILIFRESLDKSLKDFVSEEVDQEIIFREQTAYLREWALSEYDKLRWKTLSNLEHSASHAQGEFEIERVDKVKDYFTTWSDSEGDLKMWEKRRMEALAEFKKDRDKIIHQAEMRIDKKLGPPGLTDVSDIYMKLMKNLDKSEPSESKGEKDPITNQYFIDKMPQQPNLRKSNNPQIIKKVTQPNITEEVMKIKISKGENNHTDLPFNFNALPTIDSTILGEVTPKYSKGSFSTQSKTELNNPFDDKQPSISLVPNEVATTQSQQKLSQIENLTNSFSQDYSKKTNSNLELFNEASKLDTFSDVSVENKSIKSNLDTLGSLSTIQEDKKQKDVQENDFDEFVSTKM